MGAGVTMTRATRYPAAGAPAATAAPAGGAGVFGRLCRGCFITKLPAITTSCVALTCVVAALCGSVRPAAAQILSVSGIDVTFHDEIQEPPTYRVRYVAPALSDAELDYDSVAEDMERLCSMDALPRLLQGGAHPDRVVVSLMSQPVDFGVMDHETRQFFESYTVEGDRCIWEAF